MTNLVNNLPARAGQEYRGNPDRYFHVMAEGWFIYTREGLQGPFIDRDLASGHLKGLIADLKAEVDPSSSWRL